MNMRTLIPLTTLVAVSACGGGAVSEIDDAGMQQSGLTAGEQSADIAALETDAGEGELQSAVVGLQGSFATLQGQHAAYAASGSTSKQADPDTLAKQDVGLSWDGNTLSGSVDLSTEGVGYDYDVNMTFSDNDLGGTTVGGTYKVVYDLSVGGIGYSYDLSVVYDAMETDAEGCLVGGALTLKYDVGVDLGPVPVPGVGGTDQRGTVVVEYNGCDDVTILGS